jgi:hypothetical protein
MDGGRVADPLPAIRKRTIQDKRHELSCTADWRKKSSETMTRSAVGGDHTIGSRGPLEVEHNPDLLPMQDNFEKVVPIWKKPLGSKDAKRASKRSAKSSNPPSGFLFHPSISSHTPVDRSTCGKAVSHAESEPLG